MSATGLALPPWVEAAKAILDGSDNLTSSALPISADYQPNTDDVTLGTHRQEKDIPAHWHGYAGFTCPMCPVPWRRLEGGALGERTFVGKELKPVQMRTWLNTKRCTECNTRMKRWQRAKALNERLTNAHAFFGDSVLAFVTLTIPNIPDLPGRGSVAAEARLLKKRVSAFRRREKYKKIVLGGIDVVENTINEEDGSWNIHHHGIWLMDGYWDQKELQKEWGFRVHIEKVRKKHATLRYLTSYVSKAPIEGVRCLETFRALRGSAYDAIDDYLASLKECEGAEPASDEATSSSDLNTEDKNNTHTTDIHRDSLRRITSFGRDVCRAHRRDLPLLEAWRPLFLLKDFFIVRRGDFLLENTRGENLTTWNENTIEKSSSTCDAVSSGMTLTS